MTYYEKYVEKLAKLPVVHPLHPYCVSMSKRKKDRWTVYVSATSHERAELAGVYYVNSTFKKIKFDSVSARPVMPVIENMYWDKLNQSANPNNLQLIDYLRCH